MLKYLLPLQTYGNFCVKTFKKSWKYTVREKSKSFWKSFGSLCSCTAYIYMYIFIDNYIYIYIVYVNVYVPYMYMYGYVYMYTYILVYICITENSNFCLFAVNGNGKRKLIFLGWRTMKDNRRSLFQQTCPSMSVWLKYFQLIFTNVCIVCAVRSLAKIWRRS
jgi:hypothetical protein